MSSTDIFDFSMTNGTLTEFLTKVNSFTDVDGHGGVLGILLLFIIGIPLFLMMKGIVGVERAFGVTSLIIAIVGLLLTILGLIPDFVFYICIVLLIVGVLLLVKENERYEV